jgi:hypothetical protein
MPIYILQQTGNRKGTDMLKKIVTPTNNTFAGVEFILRGAKKRRAIAISNAITVNSEAGVQTKLQAVK